MAKDYILLSTAILHDPKWGRLSDSEWANKIKSMLIEAQNASIESIKEKPYQSYLNSRHWQRMRHKKLLQADFMCENCGSNENLHIHHLTYENIGRERLDDLMVLCAKCHRKVHHKDLDNGR